MKSYWVTIIELNEKDVIFLKENEYTITTDEFGGSLIRIRKGGS